MQTKYGGVVHEAEILCWMYMQNVEDVDTIRAC
jgi:hypothetical protein